MGETGSSVVLGLQRVNAQGLLYLSTVSLDRYIAPRSSLHRPSAVSRAQSHVVNLMLLISCR